MKGCRKSIGSVLAVAGFLLCCVLFLMFARATVKFFPFGVSVNNTRKIIGASVSSTYSYRRSWYADQSRLAALGVQLDFEYCTDTSFNGVATGKEREFGTPWVAEVTCARLLDDGSGKVVSRSCGLFLAYWFLLTCCFFCLAVMFYFRTRRKAEQGNSPPAECG